MLINNRVISSFSYKCQEWCPSHTKMSKISTVYTCRWPYFLRSRRLVLHNPKWKTLRINKKKQLIIRKLPIAATAKIYTSWYSKRNSWECGFSTLLQTKMLEGKRLLLVERALTVTGHNKRKFSWKVVLR